MLALQITVLGGAVVAVIVW